MSAWQRNKNKFGARKTVCSEGHPHPSALEASVCETLILREKAGEIRNRKWQHTVTLAFGIKWKVDWSFELVETGALRFAEAKGAEDRGYKLKLRMWREGAGPAPIEIWKGTAKRPMLIQTITPNHFDTVEASDVCRGEANGPRTGLDGNSEFGPLKTEPRKHE